MKNTTPRVGNPNEPLNPRPLSPDGQWSSFLFTKLSINYTGAASHWHCKLWGETAKGSKLLPSSHSLPAQARPGYIDFLVALKLFPCSSLSSQLLLVSEAWKAKAATVWGFTAACLKFSFCNGAGFVSANHCKLAWTRRSFSLFSHTASLHPHARSLSSHTSCFLLFIFLQPLLPVTYGVCGSFVVVVLWFCFGFFFFWEMFKCILDTQCLTNSCPPTFQNIEYFANEWLKSSPSSGVTLGRWAVSKTNLHCSDN